MDTSLTSKPTSASIHATDSAEHGIGADACEGGAATAAAAAAVVASTGDAVRLPHASISTISSRLMGRWWRREDVSALLLLLLLLDVLTADAPPADDAGLAERGEVEGRDTARVAVPGVRSAMAAACAAALVAAAA